LLLLGCGSGALRLEAVQPPSGRPMPADAFLRGHRVPDRVIVQNG
jgi:methionyl-tRNA formyltransferase